MIKPGMFISDRYEIIDKVGSGGMADVYKAKCHRLNRYVAIKILKPEYSDDKNFVIKFRGEAQSAAGLSHPNIVNVYDVGDDNNLHYIVMELVEGITLKNFIERKGKLEVKEAIGIAIQITMGMEAAHANHIIHRDIKPQNIIISKEGKVKVTDFGIAKATNSNTITSNAMGSVHYLSPEQARGGYSDEKSDIYSLGVTLYEMLSGRVPFAGDNTVSVALLHIQGEAASLREIDPSIPLSVDKIVQKCMQKKPERRYLSASELITDLKRSITNPNDDFVIIPAPIVSDSPTINISEDEVNHIKSVSKGAGLGLHDTMDKMQNTDVHRTRIDRQPVSVEDEEELDEVDPRMEKITLVGAIAVAVILVIIFIYIGVKFFNLFPSKGKVDKDENPITTITPTPTEEIPEEVGTIIVPAVVGYTLDEAKEVLYAKSDKLKVTYTEDYSDTFKAGTVFEQYPKKGAEISADAEVQLVVSSGPESFKLPNVYNSSEKKATEDLVNVGLIVERDYAYSDEIDEGRVIETNPARDTLVAKGDTITIIISNGPENTQSVVPSLMNLTQANALKELQAAKLTLGTVSNDYSDAYKVGTVMYQNYEKGTKLDAGTAVDITISLGPKKAEPTQKPNKPQYIGQITITDNPFDYPGESGIILIEMEQDGKIFKLFKGEKSYDNFPLPLPDIKSNSGSNGTVTMYIGRPAEPGESGAVSENGQLIKYEEYDTSWVISFTPVEG